MNPIKHLAVALAATLVLTAAASAEDAKSAATLPPAAGKTGVTYATDIKPIFEASCVKCHSGDRPKAHLSLDTLAGALKGTKQGKIVTTGDSAHSLIVKAVAHLTKDPDGWMPPPNNKAGIKPLTAEQIGLIRAWIDQGAK
jgi:mono/diheme cytochrome c family protein